MPRGFIGDVEALYDCVYNQANPNPRFRNFPRDPKAQRIRRRAEKWIWFFRNLSTEPKLVDILRKLNIAFRTQENIPARRVLSPNEQRKFDDFRRSFCHAIGEVHEIGSFIVHGEAVVQIFMHDLDNLNLFVPQDLYIKPLLKALVPVIAWSQFLVKLKVGVVVAVVYNE